MKLRAHPRLYIDQTAIERARQRPASAHLRACARHVEAWANQAVESPAFDWERNTHNAHLLRARTMQGRVLTLIVQWLRTDEARYRDAAVEHALAMDQWEYWSWITWRSGNADPEAIFDLSYGENSATLALAYDLLYPTLSDAEKQVLEDIALRRSLRSFLRHTQGRKPGDRAWWLGHPHSNWNTVCAGGAGMLALAMHNSVPEAAMVLKRVEQSIPPYMAALSDTGGAWPEGIGYWNYGMRYAFMYVLSHQHATGHPHPTRRREAIRATLRFPLDFCPHGVGCSFGDVNRWTPLPFHYAVASAIRDHDVIAALDHHRRRAGDGEVAVQRGWPTAAEYLLLHPGTRARQPRKAVNVLKLYKGQDWGILADRTPDSRIYLTLRGGTTDVPHGHRDLLSFHCVIGDEALIPSIGNGEYLDTTFSPRRWELPEMMPVSKNTILINGVGITDHATVSTAPLRRAGVIGFRIDATDAMGRSRDGHCADLCSRVVCLVKGKLVVILDRVILPHAGRVESRFHSFADVDAGRDGLTLKGQRQAAAMAFAATVPATLHTAAQAPTTPGQGAAILRWCSNALHQDFLMVTAIAPGMRKPVLTLSSRPRQAFAINVSIPGCRSRLTVDARGRLGVPGRHDDAG